MSRKFLVIRYLYSRYQYDSKAFLSSLVNKPGWAPVKLPQTGRYSSYRYSIYSRSYSRPTFGRGFDIYISNYVSTITILSQSLAILTAQFSLSLVACEQALRGALAARLEKEEARTPGELARRLSDLSFRWQFPLFEF